MASAAGATLKIDAGAIRVYDETRTICEALELDGELALRPALGVEHAIPERMQERTVAVIEPDRKARELGREVGGQHRALPYIGGLRASPKTERTLNEAAAYLNR